MMNTTSTSLFVFYCITFLEHLHQMVHCPKDTIDIKLLSARFKQGWSFVHDTHIYILTCLHMSRDQVKPLLVDYPVYKFTPFKAPMQSMPLIMQNAGYLASKKGLGIVEAVSTALTNASYDKLPKKQVLIQSDDTGVLSAFKKNSGYKRVLYVKETISDAPKPTVDEIKHSADAVNLPRSSIVADSGFFVSAFTGVVDKMHAANISVYVSVLRNEFLAIAFDYFSDPMVELATYVAGVQVDGVVTEFPATLAAYFSEYQPIHVLAYFKNLISLNWIDLHKNI